MVEMKLLQNKATLKDKLPDIEKALDMVKYLASKEVAHSSHTHVPTRRGRARVTALDRPREGVPHADVHCCCDQNAEVSTHFELNEGLFARSALTGAKTACLWLGVGSLPFSSRMWRAAPCGL